VGDNVPPTLAVAGLSDISKAMAEYVESLLSSVVASRTESEMAEFLLGGGNKVEAKAEPFGMTTESYSYDMPEALKVDFLSAMIKTKRLIQKK
jgi:hypothetical protein